MSRFSCTPTPLAGLTLVERQVIEDTRGFFSRFFCAEELARIGFTLPVAQVNHTLTRRRGAIRGLHFQHPPFTEDKFVSCLRGEIFDVAVDVRRGSPTYLAWHAEVLSAKNRRSFYIPQGFAHGFQTLSDDCELLYLHSRPYAAAAQGALSVFDPLLAIDWPLPVSDLSDRDSQLPHITHEFTGI